MQEMPQKRDAPKKVIFKQSAIVNTKECLKLKWRMKILSGEQSVTLISHNHGLFNPHSTIALSLE